MHPCSALVLAGAPIPCWSCPRSPGSGALPPAVQADVRRRLHRCCLAASLDRTLRLAYGAQQGVQSRAASELEQGVKAVVLILSMRVLPMSLPNAVSGACSTGQARGSKGRSSGSGGSSGGNNGDGDGGQPDGSYLGLLHTLSKWAAVLPRALEPGAEPECGSAVGHGGGSKHQRQRFMVHAPLTVRTLALLLSEVEEEVQRRLAEKTRLIAEAGGCGADGDAIDAELMDEVQETMALAARAMTSLAASLAFALAADLAEAAAAGGPAGPLPYAEGLFVSVGIVLTCTTRWWSCPQLLPPAQLLACQPHRLLAGACALAAALPNQHPADSRKRLSKGSACLVVTMASHEALSGRVRGWLAPPPPAPSCTGTSSSSSSGGPWSCMQPDSCAGCLTAPVRSAAWHARSFDRSYAGCLMGLLGIAAGELRAVALAGDVPGSPHGAEATQQPDGGFRRFALELVGAKDASHLCSGNSKLLWPDGSVVYDRQLVQLAACLPKPAPSALPLPLAVPPGRGAVLPRLRVCGNPRCGNFAGECESVLPLKQCGGCRTVRYCGADCQRAHWREGHRVECKVMAAAAEGK